MRVVETFYSLQGEGLQMGEPTFFIRLAGCNLDCHWCDTPYAKEEGEERTVEQLLGEADASGARVVCLTGGEPLMQKDSIHLMQLLLDKGLYVTVETNGSQLIEELPCEERVLVSLDIKCPSSGMEGRMEVKNLELLGPADQLKFVIQDEKDFDYALGMLEEYHPTCTVIFTPEGGVDLKWLAERVLEKRLQVRVLPQLHKLIWGGERGR